MRKKIVAGNWKMNLSLDEGLDLQKEVSLKLKDNTCEVVMFPPAIYLLEMLKKSTQLKNIKIGAQNGFPKEKGAFTGEVSMKQLASIGVGAVLVGHSERRSIFNESHRFLKEKVDQGLANNMTVFFCCGESLEEREKGKHVEVILEQLTEGIFHLNETEFSKIVIAYEPVWAIGTGKTASAQQANSMHESIRTAINKKYNATIAEKTTILYGGSCKPSNASELFAQPHIDGGLIGGASLKANDFIEIINAC